VGLLNRIKRIERAAGPVGGCAVCRGEGPLPPHFVITVGEALPPMPRCAGCGREFRGAFRVVERPAKEGAQT